jgi:threonine/homoserine/homoserine lactone efflux protein
MSGQAGLGWLLLHFALGYLAVNAVPGPNMLATATLATLRGLRGVLPFCLGLAVGAGLLAATLRLAFALAQEMASRLTAALPLEVAGRSAGAVLLLLLALQAMTAAPPPVGPARPPRQPLSRRAAGMAFLAGALTAATNPITAAYMAAQFLGPLADGIASWIAVLIVPAQALAWGVLVAALFSRPAIQRAALARHRMVCAASGLALAAMAVAMLRPLFG